jgi:maltooligosyltrehalose trehalohydrolase
MHKFVVCLQNHDQIGNRADGDRLHHTIEAPAWRAASALLLTTPMTVLLFMGQEWAASSPFQFFTDLEPELGAKVTEGRRREFKDFPEFADPAARERIPDPQDAATFERSRLVWEERQRPEHAQSLALYTDLLHLRNEHRALAASEKTVVDAFALDAATIAMRREESGERYLVVARLAGAGRVSVPLESASPRMVLSTEDQRYTHDAAPIHIETAGGRVAVTFARPGAVILSY